MIEAVFGSLRREFPNDNLFGMATGSNGREEGKNYVSHRVSDTDIVVVLARNREGQNYGERLDIDTLTRMLNAIRSAALELGPADRAPLLPRARNWVAGLFAPERSMYVAPFATAPTETLVKELTRLSIIDATGRRLGSGNIFPLHCLVYPNPAALWGWEDRSVATHLLSSGRVLYGGELRERIEEGIDSKKAMDDGTRRMIRAETGIVYSYTLLIANPYLRTELLAEDGISKMKYAAIIAAEVFFGEKLDVRDFGVILKNRDALPQELRDFVERVKELRERSTLPGRDELVDLHFHGARAINEINGMLARERRT